MNRLALELSLAAAKLEEALAAVVKLKETLRETTGA